MCVCVCPPPAVIIKQSRKQCTLIYDLTFIFIYELLFCAILLHFFSPVRLAISNCSAILYGIHCIFMIYICSSGLCLVYRSNIIPNAVDFLPLIRYVFCAIFFGFNYICGYISDIVHRNAVCGSSSRKKTHTQSNNKTRAKSNLKIKIILCNFNRLSSIFYSCNSIILNKNTKITPINHAVSYFNWIMHADDPQTLHKMWPNANFMQVVASFRSKHKYFMEKDVLLMQ